MDQNLLSSFNQWIAWAQQDLAHLPPAREAPRSRRICLQAAVLSVRHALGAANGLMCPDRKALCLRTLSRLRAELCTLPA